MRSRVLPALLLLVLAGSMAGCSTAQTAISDQPETPFKLATFQADGESSVGMVLGDRILPLQAANAHLESDQGLSPVTIPNEMRALIESYDRVAPRLYQIANFFAAREDVALARDLTAVRIEAPIKYPHNLLNAAANYRAHAAEMNVAKQVDPEKDFPYIFAKSPRSCIIDPEEPYIIPAGRDQIDWEGELAVVMGKPATNVSVAEALDHVFGFTIMFDVSDRAGRSRSNPMLPGPDWFAGKSMDRGAPMGPFIVPKEFLPNHDKLSLVTKVNERVVQDANTSEMIYDTAHLIHYISTVMTLHPGDVIATGTPDGVGAGRKPPEFLKPGDVVTIEIEGIGTLRTPIQAASSTD